MPKTQHDQAAGLRQIMTGHQPKIISVLSATPEQHQARLIPNLAATLSQQDSDVLVVQAAKTSAEHYGVKAVPALSDVVNRKLNIEQSVKSAKFGFLTTKLQAGQSADISNPALNQVFETLSSLFEVVLVDAGLNNKHQLPLEVLSGHDILIQLTSNASSIKEAYTLIKRVYSQVGRRSFGIIICGATDEEAAITFRNIAQVARNYMQVELEFLGAIPSDQHLSRASKLGRAVIDAFPMSTAAKAFKALAQRLHYQSPQSVEAELASYV